MKAKQWLLANGHIKEITRGRISLENIERIKDAVANGAVIDGYSVTKPVKGNTSKVPPKVEKVSVDADRIADVPDESRSDKSWRAFTSEGEIGMRTVCNTCGSSLTYCHCETPMVWLDHDREGAVYFKPNK